jgi:hypothetical protein
MASPDGCPGTQMGALTYEPEHLGGEVGLLGAPAHTFHLSHEPRRFKLAARSMRGAVCVRAEGRHSAPSPKYPSNALSPGIFR